MEEMREKEEVLEVVEDEEKVWEKGEEKEKQEEEEPQCSHSLTSPNIGLGLPAGLRPAAEVKSTFQDG